MILKNFFQNLINCQINLSKQQIEYAATDVLYLHDVKMKLDEILLRQNRESLAKACIAFLHHRVALDLAGFENDIFSHSS